ncbi:copper chaperone PCu(A)C [Aliikangiella maris]|uniref:Copper chaperone PCu(A)C n=2 Tax=Aliikangiella maris TaxID=3162458 RepID=A0ABV2BTA6_9GAMM
MKLKLLLSLLILATSFGEILANNFAESSQQNQATTTDSAQLDSSINAKVKALDESIKTSQSHSIKVSNVHMPDVPKVSQMAAIYLTLTNLSEQSVELIDVNTPVAHHSMIHQSIEEDGVAKMRHQDTVQIPANGKLEFVPGGYHIMLMGIDKQLISQTFEVELTFANLQTLKFKVKP